MTQKIKNEVVRVPIAVTLYDEDDKLITKLQANIKTKIRSLTGVAHAQNPNSRMEVTVMYSKSKDSWNKFTAKSMKEFDEKLNPCLEIDMLRELLKDGILDKKHMERRKR